MKMSPYLASLLLFAISSPPVDPLRQSLSAHSDRMFFWLVSSAITGIGVIFEAPAELHELGRWWKLRRLGKPIGWKVPITFFGLILVIGGIIGEGIFEFLSADAETAIRRHDEQVLGDTIIQAGDAKDSAKAAATDATIAKGASAGAVTASGTALTLAATARSLAGGARQEADSLTQEIVDSKQQSADASAKAADAVSRLADAENRLADATQKELAAEEALRNIKMPRSLIRTSEFVDSLKPFKGTEYVFVSVFQDEESMYLLRAIDDVLQKAGWTRGKSVAGFPGINVYGTEERNFAVPIGFKIGIQISTDSTLPSQQLESSQMKDLPLYLQAAGTLKADLAQCISPL